MSLSISAYNNPQGYHSQVNLPETPWDLVSKVIGYKQNVFDQNFQSLQQSKNTALNIQFINKERANEVDNLNKELQSKFDSLNGEYGDLSDTKNFNNFSSWFDKFSKNTDLIHAYQEDKKWQNEMSKVSAAKNSKDPIKAGYSSVNEAVFNYKLNNYANTTKDKKVDFSGYTPYKDVVAETTRIYKSLPKKEWTETIPDPQRPGYMKTVKMQGYTKDDLHNVISSLGGDMQEQFKIEAEYAQINGIKTNPTAYRDNLHSSYTSMYLERKDYLTEKLNEVKQKQALANTEEEKSQFEQIKKSIEQNITELGLGAKTKDWFLTTSEDNLLNIASQLHTERKISGLAKGLSNKPSIEYKPDMAYYSSARLAQAAQQFNANLKYKASQDAEQNKFRAADLALKAQGIGIQAGKLELEKQKELRESGVLKGNSSLFSNESSGSGSFNDLEKPTIESYGALEESVHRKAFNIADGQDYKVPFMGESKTNDQILESVLSMYDNNNPGKSLSKIKQVLQTNNLSDNISLNTVVDALPIMMNKIGNLDIKNKVGAAKTILNGILSGDSNLLNGEYKSFTTHSSLYNDEVQTQEAFNNDKAEAYNFAVRDMKNKDWNTMTESERAIVAQKSINFIEQNKKMAAYGVKERSFAELGDSPKKGQEVAWQDQSNAARIIREKTGVTFDIPQQVISSARMNPDGTTIIQFKGQGDFKKYFGEDYSDVIEQVDTKKIIKGDLSPNGYMVLKLEGFEKPKSVDNIVANGNTYQEYVNVNGVNKKVQFYKNDNRYYLLIDGKMITDNYPSTAKPSQILETVKNKLLQGIEP